MPKEKPSLKDDVVQSDAPKTEDKVQSDAPKDKEPSQESLDWRAEFPDELKTHKSLLKFKTPEDLANSYLEAERKISSNIGHLDASTPADKAGEALKKVFGLSEESYKNIEGVPEDVKKLGLTYGLKPEVLKSVVEAKAKADQAMAEVDKAKQVRDWKNEFIKGKDVEETDKNFNAGIKSMDMDYETFKKTFGDNAFHPNVLNFFEKRGQDFRKEGVTKIMEGSSTGGLPSGEEELLALHDRAGIDAAELRASGKIIDASAMEARQAEIRAKIIAERKKSGNTGGIFI